MAAVRAAVRQPAGFTLIEVLLVVVLIAIAASVAAMSIRDDDRHKLQEEGDRLAALFRMAQSEARISGRTLVWEADLTGYGFRTASGADDEKLRDELARRRAWPFQVRRVETPRILFTREPLREPALIQLETASRELRLLLDARGDLRIADCEREACAASR
jgi:general secretion pathway protein H